MDGQYDFTGRVAVVTGVGREGQIGHAVAEAFGKAGAKLIIADRDAVGLARNAKAFAAQGVEVRPAAGDLTEADVAKWVVEQAMETFGRIDVLVNVAGGLLGVAPATEAAADVLQREMAVNVTTMYLVTRETAKVMVRQKSGAIVSFASIAGLSAKPSMAAYSAAKAGVASLTRSFALELREAGVRVNAVAPGTVRTRENRASMADASDVHWVEMQDVVNAVLFLASDLASGINGHVLPISGGEV